MVLSSIRRRSSTPCCVPTNQWLLRVHSRTPRSQGVISLFFPQFLPFPFPLPDFFDSFLFLILLLIREKFYSLLSSLLSLESDAWWLSDIFFVIFIRCPLTCLVVPTFSLHSPDTDPFSSSLSSLSCIQCDIFHSFPLGFPPKTKKKIREIKLSLFIYKDNCIYL